MHSSLIATKIRTPPLRPQFVHRARLYGALDGGIHDAKLVLMRAPAGYGKTTLLSQWAHRTQLPVAWLSLEKEDNDAERLLRYLVASWDEIQPGIKQTPVGLLLGSTSPDLDSALSAFINVGSALPDHTVFVLDDCHLLESGEVYQALAFLIDHLPPTLHFVLSSRSQPPLPLARYRARGELLELGAEDLRFQDEETRVFQQQLRASGLSEAATASLQAQLQGWAAGLQLACYANRRRPESARSLSETGKHRFIADYLKEEVLTQLDAETRQFLLQTSMLDQLTGELCDAVTGRSDGQLMLETLERGGLFLAALDDKREWFRYHPLFADVLRQELYRQMSPDLASLHGRAARWYLRHAMPDQAFGHAVAAGDVDLVIQIADDYAVIKIESGELNVVARWVQMIPPDWFATYPPINLMRVAFLIHSGAFEESVRILDEVEQRLRLATDRKMSAQLAKVATVRCAIACFQNDLPSAEAYAAVALDGLPADERFYRVSIYHALGETYSRNAHWDEARDSLLKALTVVHEPSYRIRSVHIYGALADLELRQGHLGLAGDYWRRALATMQEPELWARLPIPVTGWIFIRMGELLYERNQLTEAAGHLAHGLELAELGGDVRTLVAGYLLSARLKMSEGDVGLARQFLDRAGALLDHAHFPEWSCRCKRYQLELCLAQDRPPAEVRRAGETSIAGLDSAEDEIDTERLRRARALIAAGQAADREEVLSILRDLIENALAHGQDGIFIEALALRALALWAGGDRAGALTALERSLDLAERHGYVRLFADLGLPMARLLQEARRRQVMPEYVRTLLEAFTMDFALEDRSADALPEPLSEREQEVLELMAAGLTNREIGEKLFISPETVKKHTGSIYAKFGVGHRTQAIARARELRFLNGATAAPS